MKLKLFIFILALLVVTSLSAQSKIGVTLTGHEYDAIAIGERNGTSIYMRVTDKAGKSVEGITKKDVSVTLNGENAKVRDVIMLRETIAITAQVVLVLDNSDSMKESVDQLLKSLKMFLNELGKGVQVAVVLFDENPARKKKSNIAVQGHLLNLSQIEFTTDFDAIMKTVEIRFKQQELSRRTYLWDAALFGMRKFEDSPRHLQKSIVFMSDGEDIGSEFSLEDVFKVYKLM